MSNEFYRRGDVVFVAGRGWVQRGIRLLTRSIGEERTRASHVGVITRSGYADGEAMITSAEPRGIREVPLMSYAGTRVIVYRKVADDPRDNSREIDKALRMAFVDPNSAADRALLLVGSSYPWWRILAHVLDLILFDVYLFRRVLRSSKQMECSFLVAWAYGRGLTDRPAWAVTPDDIEDWMRDHPGVWEVVRPFGLLDYDQQTDERGNE